MPAWNQCNPGNAYCVFHEEYNWVGSQNWNSPQRTVQPGDKIFASLALQGNGYLMTLRVSGSANFTISATRPVTKNFTNIYFVMEHHSSCSQLPPAGKIVYNNIQIFCEGNYVFTPRWTVAQGANPICGVSAQAAGGAVTLSWNTNDQAAPAVSRKRNRMN